MLGVERGGVCVVCVISNKNTWNPLQWQMHENQNSRIWSDIYGGKKNHEGPTWAKEKSKAKQALQRHPNIILCLRQKLSKTFSIFTPLRMCVCVCGTEEKIKNNSIRLPEPHQWRWTDRIETTLRQKVKTTVAENEWEWEKETHQQQPKKCWCILFPLAPF